MTREVEYYFNKASKHGLILHILVEDEGGTFHAAFKKGKQNYGMGYGKSAAEALKNALVKIDSYNEFVKSIEEQNNKVLALKKSKPKKKRVRL